jgi:hypothetical protein
MSMKRKAAGPSAGIALMLAVAGATMAAPVYGQTDVATKEAESRFKEGLRRHDAGDEEGARLSFLEAFSVLKRPNILFNLARAEQLTGHWVDALTHYKLFVADNTVTGSDRETARKRIAELTPLVGHVTVVAPSGADLWIDGQMLPRKAPLSEPADVSAGMHTVQARLGDQTKSVGISCQAGQTVTAKIDIEITGTPVVVVPMPGEGGPPPPPAQPEQPNPPTHYVASGAKIGTTVAFGVAAVAGIAVGVGMQVAAGSKGNDVTADQAGGNSTSCTNPTSGNAGRCQNLLNAANSQSSDENIRTGAFVAAGVLAVAAVTTWLVWPNTKTVETARHFVPLTSPSMMGLGFSTAF